VSAFSRVLAEPGSIEARRVYAVEVGGPAGELALAQLRVREQRIAKAWSTADEKTMKALLAEHGKTIAKELAPLVTSYEFHRGLPAEITLSGAQWTANASKIVAIAPIQHLHLKAPLGDLNALFAVPELAQISSLLCTFLGDAFGDRGAIALANSTHTKNLKLIDLRDSAITRAGVEAIAASPHLANVVRISLTGNPADPTPYGSELDHDFGRPPLAKELEAKFGKRAWLDVPAHDLPHYDDLAVTP